MNNIEQQAKELVDKFKVQLLTATPILNRPFHQAKQCAIISIDLIIQEYGTYYRIPNEEGKYISYWQQVKEYIQTKM